MTPETYMRLIRTLAHAGGCPRRQVGALLADVHQTFLSSGVNGPPPLLVCNDAQPCAGRYDPKGNSSRCLAIHAEVRAILACPDLRRAHHLYVPCTPCFACAKLILVTPIREVWADEVYADTSGMDLLIQQGITIHLTERISDGQGDS